MKAIRKDSNKIKIGVVFTLFGSSTKIKSSNSGKNQILSKEIPGTIGTIELENWGGPK